MNSAKISDIFISYQGEGPYTGAKQLFIRFFGCSFACVFCDTKESSYKTYTKDAVVSKVLEYKEPYHSISLTGGEPLEQADFIKEFLLLLEKTIRFGAQPRKTIYLETNGIFYEELKKIIGLIDIIAMDIKLPSSTLREGRWNAHRDFIKIAKVKELFIKIVVHQDTDPEDVILASQMVKSIDDNIPIIIQPVDPTSTIKEPSLDLLHSFRDTIRSNVKNVRIMPQWHKSLGIK